MGCHYTATWRTCYSRYVSSRSKSSLCFPLVLSFFVLLVTRGVHAVKVVYFEDTGSYV